MSRKMKISKVAGTCAVSGLMAVSLFLLTPPGLASQFGINIHAANAIVDIVAGSGSIWAILAVVGGSFGWGVALLAAGKILVKKFGKAAATTF